jgi:MFS family permease
MPGMKSGWSFMLCRFLVGVTEGPFLPAVSLMTSSWYTKHESPLRMGIWHAGNIISNVISGLLAAGILTTMDNIAGLHAWQWFFFIEGAVSILVALSGFWFLPNWPNDTGTYFFTAEESAMAQYRVDVSAGGISEDDEGSYWGGIAQAVRDPFTWMFAAIHFFLIIAQSFKDFLPSIMDTFGFSKINTYLIQAPPYIFAYFFTLALSWSSGRRLEHCWHIIGAILISLVGAVIMISTLNVGARYFSIFLLCSGPFVGLNIQISWETTVVPRPRTKRAALIAIANCVSSVSLAFSVPLLHQILTISAGLPLVHPILLPDVPGAKVPDWRWCHHRRMWTHSHLLSGGEMVGYKEEQEIGCAAGAYGRCQPLALRHLDAHIRAPLWEGSLGVSRKLIFIYKGCHVTKDAAYYRDVAIRRSDVSVFNSGMETPSPRSLHKSRSSIPPPSVATDLA